MEEMKNGQPEEVMEQRPSTKYGRTAYQEQLRQEQAAQENSANEYARQNWEAGASQNAQQNWQCDTYTPYVEPKVEVRNTFANILMVLVAITALINCVASAMTLDAFVQLETIDALAVLDFLAESSTFTILSYVGDMIFWVTVVLFVLDIIALHKANYKIGGAIAFAILLRPVYFIWRAHLLGKKKTAGIIYAVGYYGFCVVEYIMIFRAVFNLVIMLGY